MKNKIEQILEELYMIDKDLKEKEKDLKIIIKKLLASRPDTELDEQFMASLKQELLKEAQELYSKPKTNLMKIFNTKFIAYSSLGLIALALISLSMNNIKQPTNEQLALLDQKQPQNTNSNYMGERAFGSLSGEQPVAQTNESFLAKASSSEAPAVGLGGGGGVATSERMIKPAPYSFNYIYDGDDFTITEDKITVLKRILDENSAKNLAKNVENIEFNNIKLSQFSDLKLQNISLMEDKEYGYSINIVPQEGILSIYQNYDKWPHPERECLGNSECYQSYMIKKGDVPADDKLIKIAKDFLADLGINTDNYAPGMVNKTWETFDNNTIIGESVQVIYPLLVNNQKVFEEGGSEEGLNVNINIREGKAEGMWNYKVSSYESSDYTAETDAKRIIKFAEQGGRYTYRYQSEEKEDVKLDTPYLAYVKIWKSYPESNTSNELLVPAYVFPIKEKPENTPFYIKNIVVPLAKELLDEADRQNQDVIITPYQEDVMPVIRKIEIDD